MTNKTNTVINNKALSSISIVLTVAVIIVVLLGSVVFYFWFVPGNLKTEKMNFTDFNSVDVGWAFDLTLNQGNSYSVAITADEKIFDLIEVTQTENKLSIGFKDGTMPGNLFRKAEITMPELDELILTGASKGVIDGYSSSTQIYLELSGASSLDTSDLEVHDIEIEVSGASSLTSEGTGNNLSAIVSGASKIDLSKLSLNDADMQVTGASKVTINIDGRLDAQVSGASTLEYLGEPTLGEINTSGVSTIRKK